MEDEIINFICSQIALSEDEKNIIREVNLIRHYKKDTILLEEGQYSKECFYIIQGCVRSYYLIDGNEKTTEFYTENETIRTISYAKKEPSKYYLSCLEDCVISAGSEEKNKILIEKIPKLETLISKMNNQLLVENQISFDNFKNMNPEMRYQHVIATKPYLLDRVPQYHLATYLGITPVSLSRMRKRILGNRFD